jgi:hypothetical protein
MTAAELAEILRADPARAIEALRIAKIAGRRQSVPFARTGRVILGDLAFSRHAAEVFGLLDDKGQTTTKFIAHGPGPEDLPDRRGLLKREDFTGEDEDEVAAQTDSAWEAAGWVLAPPTEEEIRRKAEAEAGAAGLRRIRADVIAMSPGDREAHRAKCIANRDAAKANGEGMVAFYWETMRQIDELPEEMFQSRGRP